MNIAIFFINPINPQGISRLRKIRILLVICITIFQLGCGIIEVGNPGPDDEPGSLPPIVQPGMNTIKGNVLLGQISYAEVALYSIEEDGSNGNLISSGNTDNRGNFEINVPEDFAGPGIFNVSKGSYKDVSTGNTQNVQENQILRLYMPTLENNQKVAITSLTEIASSCIAKKLQTSTDKNLLISDINENISQLFGIPDISKVIIDRYFSFEDTSLNKTRYALIQAGFSEFALINGADGVLAATESFADDYSDCIFDGKNENGDVIIKSTSVILPADAYEKGIWDAIDSFIKSGKKIE